MRETNLQRWYGVALSALGLAATAWLAWAGKLDLYIHPRYVVFTTVMTVVAGALTIASFAIGPEPHDHVHETPDRTSRRQGTLRIAGAALLGFWVIALLVVPPAGLTVVTATQRQVNQTIGRSTTTVTRAGEDYSHFRLRDWAVAIQLAASPRVLTGHPFDEIGFVTPVGHRPDLFYVTRFDVTCCTVDAQPIGVAVHDPGWRSAHRKGTWVHVSGTMGVDPADANRAVVNPRSITPIAEPDDPYKP